MTLPHPTEYYIELANEALKSDEMPIWDWTEVLDEDDYLDDVIYQDEPVSLEEALSLGSIPATAEDLEAVGDYSLSPQGDEAEDN